MRERERERGRLIERESVRVLAKERLMKKEKEQVQEFTTVQQKVSHYFTFFLLCKRKKEC